MVTYADLFQFCILMVSVISLVIKGNTAQFGKQIRREIFRQVKVWKTEEYCMYFPFFKPKNWRKRSAEARRRNCAVLPKVCNSKKK